MRTYQIYNCPITGLKRQVRIQSNRETGTSIALECIVDFLDNDDLIINRPGIHSYSVLLVADNETKVNQMGQKDPSSGLGEYEWIIQMIESKTLTPRQIEAGAVAARAAEGRFD